MKIFHILLVILALLSSEGVISQQNSIFVPVNVQKAYARKTRSLDGKPGIVYWQNRADYKININLDPKTLLITGNESIAYTNNSPDSLRSLIFNLFPNMFKKGNMRDCDIDPADESDGLIIDKLSINGKEISVVPENDLLYTEHTLLRLRLIKALSPDKKINIDIDWHYTLNRNSHIRTGVVDSTSFFVAYFFPRIAVYDDIDGWCYYKYTNEQEFYNDFGNYDVTITMPRNYIVWATGVLQNPEEVLNPKYLNRYKAVDQSNIVMKIIDTADLKLNDFTKPNPFNTWRFKAENVTDFAFASSNHYLWDATSISVEKSGAKKLFLDVAYNKNSKDFYKVASIARQAIDLMCNSYPGIPYPYPKISVFNGLSEMEYPMIVNDRSYDDYDGVVDLTAHEIFHGYFPFYCGLNEVNYGWMDEGLTTYATYHMVNTIDPENAKLCFNEEYNPYIGTNLDLPIYTNSSSLRRPVYDYISYPKPAIFLLFLNDILGDEVFKKSTQEFILRWNGKHPTPYDFFNTFSNVSGQDIYWFVKPWIFEFGYVDLGIKEVIKSDKYTIIVERKGSYPAPINLKITYDDGNTELLHQTPAVWKNGEQTFSFEKPVFKKIKKVELIDEYKIDVNPSNNSYTVNGWKLNQSK